MREIILTQGKIALVDDADYESISKFRWYAHFNGSKWYAMRDTATEQFRMHRQILGVTSNKILVDHRNRDGLDNQRHNLRRATKAENAINSKLRKGNKSGLRGVHFDKARGKWAARLSYRHLGRFDDPLEAARAYDRAALKHHGEFARLDFQ